MDCRKPLRNPKNVLIKNIWMPRLILDLPPQFRDNVFNKFNVFNIFIQKQGFNRLRFIYSRDLI